MNRPFRLALFITGIVTLLFALGFLFNVPFVTGLWPLPAGRLSPRLSF